MFFTSVKSHLVFLLKRKEAICVFFILLFLILRNFIQNVIEFQGFDVRAMYQPMRLLLLSYDRVHHSAEATTVLIQLYPLLVVCPAGFAFVKAQQSGEDILLMVKQGRFAYFGSKLLAAFLTTMVVMMLPFLIELVLNCIAFPLQAEKNLSHHDVYDPNYVTEVRQYLMSGLYIQNPYVYAVFGTLLFGLVSGLLGCFTAALSCILRVKYQVFLFLPVFFLLHGTVYLTGFLPEDAPTSSWYDYLLIFQEEQKNLFFYCIFLLILILLTLCCALIAPRKDQYAKI